VTLVSAAALGAASSAGRLPAAAPVGAALALLPDDLGERAMLGDSGANALGGMLGAAAATALPRPARVAVLAAVTGLTAASEIVSFTRVIERTPLLRWLDMLGRRPAGAVGTGTTSGQDGADTPTGDEDGEPDGRHQAGGPASASAAAPR
jgi:UDP-GlcNAc:undecaprenyl-phosphate/decaprenyl-phosphate GlcNAc-1-phosphate transferase